MGLFDRFKALLKKKEPLPDIVIPINQLENWLNQQSSEAILLLDKKLNEIYEQITQEITALKQHTTELQNAQLMNENIVLKAKQIMEGNRESYIKRLEQFISKLDVSNKGYFSAKNLITGFDSELALFLEATQKNYYVLQEFFAHETKAVTNTIQDIGKGIITLKGIIEQSNVDEMYHAKQLLKEIHDKERLIKEKEQIVAEKKQQVHDLLSLREKVEQKLESLKKSEAFNEFNSLIKKRDRVLKELNEIDKSLYEKFSILDRPLRKYMHSGEYEKLLAKYQVHAITALIEDETFELLQALEQVKKAIEQDAVALKDKQKEKVLEIISLLTKEELSEIKKNYLLLKAEKQELERRIKTSSLQQDYNELCYKVDHYHTKGKRIIEEINGFEQTMYQAHIDDLQQKLQQTLQNINFHLKIEFTPLQKVSEEKQESVEQSERQLRGTTVEIVLDEDALKDLSLESTPAVVQKETIEKETIQKEDQKIQ